MSLVYDIQRPPRISCKDIDLPLDFLCLAHFPFPSPAGIVSSEPAGSGGLDCQAQNGQAGFGRLFKSNSKSRTHALCPASPYIGVFIFYSLLRRTTALRAGI